MKNKFKAAWIHFWRCGGPRTSWKDNIDKLPTAVCWASCFTLLSLPSCQRQQPCQWPYTSKYYAAVSPVAPFLEVPLWCSREEVRVADGSNTGVSRGREGIETCAWLNVRVNILYITLVTTYVELHNVYVSRVTLCMYISYVSEHTSLNHDLNLNLIKGLSASLFKKNLTRRYLLLLTLDV